MGHTRTSIVFAMVMAGGLAASLPAAAAFDDVRRPPLGPPTEQSSAALDPVATPQREAAEQGDAAAQFALGGQYTTGDGVPQDMAQAVEWWRRAGRTGSRAGGTQPGDGVSDRRWCSEERRHRGRLVSASRRSGRSNRPVAPRRSVRGRRGHRVKRHRGRALVAQGGGPGKRRRAKSSRAGLPPGRRRSAGLRAGAPLVSSCRRSGTGPGAVENLGFMCQNGQGVARDPTEPCSGGAAPPWEGTPAPSSTWPSPTSTATA